jgi:outer membrane lipoprotein-sorting protein
MSKFLMPILVIGLASSSSPVRADKKMRADKKEISVKPAFGQDKGAAVPSRKETLKRVKIALEKHKTLKAHFVQRAQNGSVLEGTLYLKRPGKLRFEYTKDVPYLMVSNGSLISFIDYDLGDVMRWPIAKTPMGLLVSDKIDLDDERIEIPKIIRFAGLLNVTIIDPDKAEFGQITLIFEESDMEFKGWDVLDAQGTLTHVSLLDMKYDLEMKNSLFTYKDPRPKRKRKR